MLKPNFNPLFYGKFVYTDPERPSSEVNINDEQIKFNRLVRSEKTKVHDAMLSAIREYNLSKLERVKSYAKGLIVLMEGEEAKFSAFVRSDSFKKMTPEQQRTAIRNKKAELKSKIAKFNAKIKEQVETEKNREKLLDACKKSSKSMQKRVLSYFNKLNDAEKEAVGKNDLMNLMKAYTLQWEVNNETAVKKLDTAGVKHYYSQVSNGEFKTGSAPYERLLKIENRMKEIMVLWIQGKPRSVYEKPMPDVHPSWNPVPKMPDVGKFKNDALTVCKSPFDYEVVKKLKAAQEKERVAVIKQHGVVLANFKKLGGVAADFYFMKDKIAKLGKKYKYGEAYTPEDIVREWEDDADFSNVPLIKEEMKILKDGIARREKFNKLSAERKPLVEKIKEKNITPEEIKNSPAFKRIGFEDNALDDFDNFLAEYLLEEKGLKAGDYTLDGQNNDIACDIELFSDVLKEIKEYKVSPKATLNGSKLDIQVSKGKIPKPIQKKIKDQFKKALKLDIKGKYAQTNVALNGKDAYKKLIKENLTQAGIPGRVKVENPDVVVNEEPKGATAVGYASFDSTGNDYQLNYKRFALGRAKGLGVAGAKIEGKVMGVDKNGNSVEIKNSKGVKESWQNLTALYQKLAKEKKLSKGTETEADLRKMVAEYNKGGKGFKPEQKKFFDKYFGQWRKAELDLTRADKAHKFDINVQFA